MCSPYNSVNSLLAEHSSLLGSLGAESRRISDAHVQFIDEHDALRDSHKELQTRHFELQKEMVGLREEFEALRDCLDISGYVRQREYRRRLSIRRAPGVLRDVLQMPEHAIKIGRLAGITAFNRASEANQAFNSCMRPARPPLMNRMPPDIYVFGGKNDGSSALATAERFSIVSGQWQTLPPMPTRRYGCAAAALSGCLYVVGGHDGKQVLRIAERYDPVCRSWESLPPMPTARSRCAAASLQGFLYVVGGIHARRCSRDRVTAAERFDPHRGSWEHMPPMPLAPLGCAAAILGQNLCVVGVDAENNMAIQRLDPRSLRWDPMLPVPRQRFGCAAASVAGELYVVGGHDGQQAVAAAERYNAERGVWEPVPSMATARHGCAAACATGQLFVIGGDDGRSLGMVERFDPGSGTWQTLPPLPTGRFGCTAAAAWA